MRPSLLAILVVASLHLAILDNRTASIFASPQANAALRDTRARLQARASDETRRGDVRALILTLTELLAVDRSLTGEASSQALSTRDALAAAYERSGDFGSARKERQRLLDLLTASLGTGDWRVASARARLDHAVRMTSLSDDDRKQLATVSALMAQAAQRRGNDAQGESKAAAVPLLEQALAIQRKVMGDRDTATMSLMSQLASTLGPGEQAERLLQQVLAIRRQTLGPVHPDVAKSLQDLARLHTGLGQYDAAEPLIQQTIAMFSQTLGNDHPETTLALMHLGAFYKTVGRYGLAEEPLQRAWQTYRRALGETNVATLTALEEIGSAYKAQRDYARAEPIYRQLVDLQRKASGDAPSTARALIGLANVYRAGGPRERAGALYEQALEILRRHPAERLATGVVLLNIGSLHASEGRLTLAQPALEEALTVLAPFDGYLGVNARIEVTNHLAAVQAIRGDFDRAEALMLQSVALRTKGSSAASLEDSVALGLLANIYAAKGDDERARPLFQQSIAASRTLLDLAAIGQSERQQLAMAQSFRHRLDDYATLATRSPRSPDDLWAEVVAWKGATLARQRMYRTVARQPETTRAFERLQASASHLAALALSGADEDEAGLDLSPGFGALSSGKEQLEAELARIAHESRAFLKLPTPADVRAALPPDTVLIDLFEYQHSTGFLRSEPRLLAFVVPRQGEILLISLGSVAPIAKAVVEWRATQGRGVVAEAAGLRLRSLIWTPIESALAKLQARQLLFAMDGVIGQVPIGALPGAAPGSYLLEEWAIATIPAAQLVPDLLQSDRPVASGMLLLGGVNYDRRDGTSAPRPAAPAVRGDDTHFTGLDGTRGEVEAIAALHRALSKTRPLTTLTGAQATEAAVRQEAAMRGYLHLATHGFFAAERFKSALDRSTASPFDELTVNAAHSIVGYHPGLLSGLVLAGANQPTSDDDGILTAEEVSTLDLSQVELIVLSACETGLGQVAGGEGLLGLQRAFHAAGARTVVATFWKVDDATTRDIMTRFYDNLWNKGMGKLAALREAQLWILQRSRGGSERPAAAGSERSLTPVQPGRNAAAPYYWASFVLSGDWR